MLQDFRLAARALLRTPGFTLTTIATLALATGANAAILAVVYSVLIRPLPYADPDRLVAVWPGRFQSNADLTLLRERGRMFSSLAAVAPGWSLSLTGYGEPTRVTLAKVSGNLFETLGTTPLLGRPFGESAARPGADTTIVLTYDFWRKQFNSDPSIVGRPIVLDGEPYQVAAVMPKSFGVFGLRTDGFVPFAIDERAWYHPLSFSLFVARLGGPNSLEQADAEYRRLIPEIRRLRGYPNDYGRTARLSDLRTAMVGDVTRPLGVLASAVALILLIAAANIGTLQLTRATARSRDLAVRSALGASRARILRQLGAESLLLAATGGITGVLVAYVALPALAQLLPSDLPRVHEVGLDFATGAIVFGAAVLIGLMMGAAPGIPLSRLRALPLLRAGASTESRGARRTRAALVCAEIALAVVLTVGAGLMLRTLWRLNAIDPGFDAERVLSLHVQPTGERYSKLRVADYYESLLERLRAVPGVEAAGAIQHLPFSGFSWNTSLDIQGFEPPAGASRPVAGLRIVLPGYFNAIGQPMLRGQDFSTGDGARQDRVIVNDSLARQYYGSADAAVGRTLRIRGGRLQSPWMTVIAVVRDVHHTSLTVETGPEIYTAASHTTIPAMMLAIRSSGDPRALVPAVREAIRSVDREVPLSDIQTMATRVGTSLGRPRLLLALLGGFAVIGVTLAVVGIYGVIAYSVALRRRELGIMMALGAERGRIMRVVYRQALGYAAIGLALGMPASLAAGRFMRTVLWGVGAADPLTYGLIAGGTLAIVAAAVLRPALTAARVDPGSAIREPTG